MSRKEVGYLWIESTNSTTKKIGLSQKGLERIGKIVWFSTPPIGTSLDTNETLLILESSKAAIELESPLKGEIIHAMECTDQTLSSLNQHPEGFWLVEVVDSSL